MSTLHMSQSAPPGDPPNLPMLIKLLKLTASPHDGEALAATRKANAALEKFGGDWEALLRGKVTIIADPFTVEVPRTAPKTPPPPPRAQTPPPPPRPRATPRYGVRAQAAQAAAFTPIVRPNKFGTVCKLCGDQIAADAGVVVRHTSNGPWVAVCSPCKLDPGRSPASNKTKDRPWELRMSKQTLYLGNGVTATLDETAITLTNGSVGRIILSPTIFKRLIRAGTAHFRSLPEGELEAQPPIAPVAPLRTVSRTRDEEMAEWEATMKRKRESAARPTVAAEKSKKTLNLEDFA